MRGGQRSIGKESLYRGFQRCSEGGGQRSTGKESLFRGLQRCSEGPPPQMNSEKERGVEKEKEWGRKG